MPHAVGSKDALKLPGLVLDVGKAFLGNFQRLSYYVYPTSGLGCVFSVSNLWCPLPHEIPRASGPAAKVKESSLGRPYTPLPSFSGPSKQLKTCRCLRGWSRYGKIKLTEFYKRHFDTASPFDTLSPWSSYALRKTISLRHKDPHCK